MTDSKTVASLDEWSRYADGADEPIGHAVGEFADEIRTRFGANKHVPVTLREEIEYDYTGCDCCSGGVDEYVVIECGEQTKRIYQSDLDRKYRDWLDEPRRRAEEEAEAAAAYEREEKIAHQLAINIHNAALAVEAEGYTSDQDWHDKLMTRLGVRGYGS